MTIVPIDESQRKAAKVVGFSYLFAMVTANFSEFFARGHLIVYHNAAETARNIIAHERLFRLGTVSMFLCFLTDVALIAALYVILSRVSKGLALFAAFMRLVETGIGVAAALNSFDALRLLGRADYLHAFTTDQVNALAQIPLHAYDAAFNACLVPFGIGSAVFGYLWFKSRYISRVLAALGVFGSLLVAVGALALMIAPGLAGILIPWDFIPIFFFELIMGFWLLFGRLEPSGAAGSAPATG